MEAVQLTILKESKAPSRPGFGRGLLLAKNAPLSSWGADRIRAYTGDEDGKAAVKTAFGSGSEEYAWTLSLLSQRIRPPFFYIGLRQSGVAQVKTITINVDFESGDEFVANVNGLDIAVPFGSDHAATCAAIATAIADAPGIATCTTSGSPIRVFTITAEADWLIAVDGLDVTGTGAPEPVLATTTAGRTIATDVGELAGISRDWYALAFASRTAGMILEGARGAQATNRMFFPVTGDAGVITTGEDLDIASRLFALGYDRTAWTYHDAGSEWIDAAMFGTFLTINPGSIVFANKPLTGITRPDLSTTEAELIESKNGNYIADVQGRSWYERGKTADGGFIDTRRNLDYMHLNILSDLLDMIGGEDLIPFTQEGVDRARGKIMTRLGTMSKTDKIIKGNYKVPPINVADIPSNDRQNRLLPDLTFEADLQGAIQTLRVVGRVKI